MIPTLCIYDKLRLATRCITDKVSEIYTDTFSEN